MPRIGIIGFKTDPHVGLLVREIERHGAEAVVIDFYNFPRFNLLSFAEAATFDDIHVKEAIEFSTIDLLFIRNFVFPFPVSAGNREQFIKLGRHATTSLFLQYGVVRMWEQRIPVINNLDSMLFHRLKSYQMFLLTRHRLTVPATLSTNNTTEVEAFIGRFPQGVIAKPGASGAEVVMADREFFDSNDEILKNRPFLFQQYVKGKSLRAYCLGGEIISIGEIVCDSEEVDWREKKSRIDAFEAGRELILEIAKASKVLNLAFCSVDMEYDAYTRKYYLLDLSPAPLFAGWSKSTNTNIAGRIVEYLLRVIDNRGIIWKDS